MVAAAGRWAAGTSERGRNRAEGPGRRAGAADTRVDKTADIPYMEERVAGDCGWVLARS